ncbi:hypothetical protein [Brevundimonas sp.]|uniref:hypothetical protein n=1 Tax=Brevundimonas sp. TaxID=1871086 RepID=UPI002D74567C|nr:hypothetical protein [Brevundimonas sp.]HYD28595.1 hypothetical protein [Brevundimonas sp.]
MRGARTLVAAFAAALVWPATGWSQAAVAPARLDLIQTLNQICVAAHGDRERAAALALEAGFSPTPAETVPHLRNSSEASGFVRSTSADMAYVITGLMTRRIGRETVQIEFCGVSARPTDHRALDARLREVMGFAPVRGAGFEAYAWLQTPEGRAPTRSLTDPQFVSMAATGQMRMIGLDRAGPGSTLIYFLPRID